RATEHVEARIESGAKPRRVAPKGRQLLFEETMSGLCMIEESEGGGTRALSFTVRARGDARPRAEGGVWQLEGRLRLDGIVRDAACEGTLELRPLRRKATLVYDLAFTDDEGRACTLHGEKHTGWSRPL